MEDNDEDNVFHPSTEEGVNKVAAPSITQQLVQREKEREVSLRQRTSKGTQVELSR